MAPNHSEIAATPTKMIRASSLVNHADGSYSHTSYRRLITQDEIERERFPPALFPKAPIVYPEGIPDGYGNALDRPTHALWRQLAEVVDCIITYKRIEAGTHQPFIRKYPRMSEEHWYGPGPYGYATHFVKFLPETPEQDAWNSRYLPTRGLHRDDLLAFYRAQRGPTEKGLDWVLQNFSHQP